MEMPIINWQYKNFVPLAIHWTNAINKIIEGEFWVACVNDINIDTPIKISYKNETIDLIITQVKKYNYCVIKNLDNKKYYTYHLTINHPMIRMEYNQFCKCWNNLSIQQIINQLMMEYNIPYKNNIKDNQAKPLIIQYNETDGNFFQRILGLNNYFFYWDQGFIHITDNLISNHSLKPEGLGYQYQSIIPSIINDYQYDYINQKNSVNHEFTVKNNNLSTNSYKVFNHHHYKNYNKNYSSYIIDQNCHMGDMYNDEKIISKYVQFLWHDEEIFLKNIYNKNTWSLPGIPQDYSHYIIIKTLSSGQFIPYYYEIPSINHLTAFVKSINGVHSNKYGDILVEFPWKNHNNGVEVLSNTAWVRCCQSMAQNNRGSWIIPQPNDEVVLGFLNNNWEEMFIMGTLYNKSQSPFLWDPQLIYLKSQDNTIIINEKDHTITIKNNSHININIKNGDHNFTIDKGQWNVNLKNGPLNYNINGDVIWNVTGNTQWKVSKDFSINSANINFSSGGFSNKLNSFDVKTTTMAITSKKMDLKSSMIDIDGSIINVKGQLLDMSMDGLINISSNMIMMNGEGMMNITTGLFNVMSTSSVIIRGSSPGAIGSFPPYYP